MAMAISEDPTVLLQSDLPNAAFAVMEEMRQKGEMCDVVIKVDDSETSISAHRVVLSATIPYFRTMFRKSPNSRFHEIQVKGVESIAMEALINFTYSGKITIQTSNVRSLFIGASYLKLASVRDACAKYLEQQFLRCMAEAVSENFSELSKNEEFLESTRQLSLNLMRVGLTPFQIKFTSK